MVCSSSGAQGDDIDEHAARMTISLLQLHVCSLCQKCRAHIATRNGLLCTKIVLMCLAILQRVDDDRRGQCHSKE